MLAVKYVWYITMQTRIDYTGDPVQSPEKKDLTPLGFLFFENWCTWGVWGTNPKNKKKI